MILILAADPETVIVIIVKTRVVSLVIYKAMISHYKATNTIAL
jgi:hypothetical protein